MTATTDVRTTSTETTSTDTSSIDTYRSMRRGLRIVAFFLPVALYVGWTLWGSESWLVLPRSSMSSYYYTGARDIFVGALWAIGVFLILYRTKHPIESLLLTVAGFAALAIALFPMSEDGDCNVNASSSFHSKVHGISAVVFFCAISIVCLFFPATRYIQTRVCTAVMMACILVTVAYRNWAGTELKDAACSASIIFFIEFFAVWAFAWYWGLKSRDTNDSLKRWLDEISAKASASLKEFSEGASAARASLKKELKKISPFKP